jgi:mercuric ion binding protein
MFGLILATVLVAGAIAFDLLAPLTSNREKSAMTKMHVAMTLALGALAAPALAGETTVTLAVRNWYCAACPHVIKQSLAAVPGVINVTVSDKTKTASITFEDTKTDVKSLTQATAEAGYPSFLHTEGMLWP